MHHTLVMCLLVAGVRTYGFLLLLGFFFTTGVLRAADAACFNFMFSFLGLSQLEVRSCSRVGFIPLKHSGDECCLAPPSIHTGMMFQYGMLHTTQPTNQPTPLPTPPICIPRPKTAPISTRTTETPPHILPSCPPAGEAVQPGLLVEGHVDAARL